MTKQEREDREFDQLLADKRHKELCSVFKEIKEILSQPDQQQTVIEKKIGSFEELLRSFTTQKTVTVKSPDVKVEVNQQEVVKSVMDMSQKLLRELEKFNKRPIPVRFDIEQNRAGSMTAVNIIYQQPKPKVN
jgi:hypothetical protein